MKWKQIIRNCSDLAENIAQKKQLRLIICIDEFQNLCSVQRPSALFQQRLRASWQQHKQVSYCLYGSKKHMMIEIFQNKDMPFYKFGDVIFLEKIKYLSIGLASFKNNSKRLKSKLIRAWQRRLLKR